MTTKQDILYHIDGVKSCELKDWRTAIKIFHQIQNPYATIYFNLGCCYLQEQEYLYAEDSFKKCIAKDKYLAVGHYQLGISQVYLDKLEEALASFNQCLTCLRSNAFIDYNQLSMACKLYACEVKMNMALMYLFLGDANNSRSLMLEASNLPREEDKNHLINSALNALDRQNWAYFGDSVLSKLIELSSECVFHPNKSKLDGIQSDTSKFSKAATVVAATNDEYSFTGFVGAKKLQNSSEPRIFPKESVTMPPPPNLIPPRDPRRVQQSISPSRVPSKPSFAPPSRPPPITNLKSKSPTPNQKGKPQIKSSQNEKAKPLNCNLKLCVSLERNEMNSYQAFTEALSKYFQQLSNGLKLQNTGGWNMVTDVSQQPITSKSWHGLSSQAVSNNKFDVCINSRVSNVQSGFRPEKKQENVGRMKYTPVKSPFKSPPPQFVNTNAPVSWKEQDDNSDIYQDQVVGVFQGNAGVNNQDEESDIYSDGNLGQGGQEVIDEIYSDI